MDPVVIMCVTGIAVAAIAAMLVIFYAGDEPIFGGRDVELLPMNDQASALMNSVGSVKSSGKFESCAVQLIGHSVAEAILRDLERDGYKLVRSSRRRAA